MSTALFLEYEDVVERPEIRLATGMREGVVDGFLAALASAAEGVEVNFRWRPQLSDPKDELVLEAAVNGEADALVTHISETLNRSHDSSVCECYCLVMC